jgi:hypothetical protein
MRFHGVLVRPLGEQRDRDDFLIDPAGVTIPDREVPIYREFDYRPEAIIGSGRVSRGEDGSLVMEGELTERYGTKLAIGVRTTDTVHFSTGATIARTSGFMAVGLTRDHKDPGQPDIEELEDSNDDHD